MRKNRFCTFTLISALMIAALPASLAAAGSNTDAAQDSLPVHKEMTLTITPQSGESYNPEGSAYTAYRVMSFTQNDGSWNWDIVNGFVYPGQGSFNPDAFGAYPAAKLQTLADQLALQVDDDSMTDKLEEKPLSGGSCSWTTQNAGIYLVLETATKPGNFPAAPFLVSLPCTDSTALDRWIYDVTASPKGSPVGLQKVIHKAKGAYSNTLSYDGKKDTVANGDTVQYTITTKIPAYTEVYFQDGKNPTFRLIDTMAKGLTLQPSTIRLSAGTDTLTLGTDYTQDIATDDNGCTVLTVNLSGSYLQNQEHHNTDLVLALNATVNEKVSLAADGNENKAQLQYSYDPLKPDETKEINDNTKVYSFGIEVEKFDRDAGSVQKLAGAQFALYKEAPVGSSAAQMLAQEPFRQAQVTDENGLLDFTGLDAGTYYLKEVKAPSGYSLMMNPIKIEIIPDSAAEEGQPQVINSGSFTARVNGTQISTEGGEGTSRILQAADREGTVIVAAANHKGITLPLTGGSGIIVILITAAAGMALMVLLFVRESGQGRKNSREQV